MRELLPLIQRPSHYTGCEHGCVRKNPDTVRARVALAFPDLYEVGMSYTGQALLYHTVNQMPQFWAERTYAPTREAADLMRERGCRLATLESDTALGELDAVGFHITHELCYTNVLYMLDLAGIPLHAADRDLDRPLADASAPPLILAGGGCTFNAEALAPFMDFMVLGDGETILPDILERIVRAKEQGQTRREFLAALTTLPGIYVPALFKDHGPGKALESLLPGYERVEKCVLPNLDAAPYPFVQPQAIGAVHDRYTIEIARGCTRGCRFCHAGMVYRPVRERSLPVLKDILYKGLEATGYGEISFLSLSTGDFSNLEGLFAQSVNHCRQELVSISLPSLRVGSVDENIMRQIAGIRRTGATLAPEAGSQRMRDVINKGVTEEQLMEHVSRLFENGWNAVKLYFMIGLPTEQQEDLDAILELCRKVERKAFTPGEKGPRRLQVTAAISPFVPKPHTPFQWEPQITLEEISRRVAYLKEIFRPFKRLKLRWHVPDMSFLEGLFSRADRRLAQVVESAYRKGALFCSWNDQLDLQPWYAAFAECGWSEADYLALIGPRDPDLPLPWDHLETGVSKAYLKRERRRALEGKLTPDCRFENCSGCGVCNHEGKRSRLAAQAGVMEIRPRLNQAQRAAAAAAEETDQASEKLGIKAAHYRLWYSKTGTAAFISQLELQAMLERAMRRARLPMSFSQGFHPLPLLSFARALPVGVESLEEHVDIYLRQALSPQEVLEALNPQLPDGLELLRVEPLEMKKKQPQSVAETYELRLHGDEEQCRAIILALEEFMAQENFVWSRMTKKGLRQRDIRPLFSSLRLFSDHCVKLRLDWSEIYLNPLAMLKAIVPDLDPMHFALVKISQHFAQEPRE